MTPLDFRLIAIPFFRLIDVHCQNYMETIKRIQEAFRTMRHTSRHLLSTASFSQQVNKFIGTFYMEIDYHMISSSISNSIMFSLRQSNVYSALHTNAIQTTVPGSNIYRTMKNIYPINDNASVINVS